MAAAAAEAMGVPAERALAAMAGVEEVAGRFTTRRLAGRQTRLMLAKNPAGWAELLSLVCPGDQPGGGLASTPGWPTGGTPRGCGTSPFEQLRGRPVVATGERCRDLAVRLRYAEVPHATVADPLAAVAAAGRAGRRGGASGVHRELHRLPRPPGPAVSAAALTVVVVYPDLLGTYGDGGNGLVLARRAAWRGIEVELVEADSDGPLPAADLYCLGGGEDGPQVRAADAPRPPTARCRRPSRRGRRCWRSAPATRSSAAPSPTPRAGRARGSACST